MTNEMRKFGHRDLVVVFSYAFSSADRSAIVASLGCQIGHEWVNIWEHVLELDNGTLEGDFRTRADGVWRVVVDATCRAAAENHRPRARRWWG